MSLSKPAAIIGYSAAAIGASAFLWEYIARRNSSAIKPSIGINFALQKSRAFFGGIGHYAAKLSSFYHMINIKEVQETFNELFMPILKLIISPFYVVKGYWDTATTGYKYPFVILAGTLTLVATMLYLGNKYYGHKISKFTMDDLRKLMNRNVPNVTITQH